MKTKANGKLLQLEGRLFGKLTVSRRSGSNKYNRALWLCVCECGTSIIVDGTTLTQGNTKSCGCSRRNKGQGHYFKQYKHGMSDSPEYRSYTSMKTRCLNKSSKDYPNWGGRGITICERWLASFSNFYEDMGPRPEGCELDRKNPYGNYEPDNCRWWPPGLGAMRKRRVRL